MDPKVVLEENFDAILIHYFFTQWQHSLNASLLQMILVFAKTRITNFQDSGRSGIYKNPTTVLGHLGCLRAVVKNNKAGYTAQDAPSTRMKITRDRQTDGRTDRHILS